MNTVVASVDIGTNTVRCLIGEWDGTSLRRGDIAREITRLGEGLRASGRLIPEAEERTLAALRRFGQSIRSGGARLGRAVATSASRDGGTAGFFSRMEEALGFPVEVISGEEEAALTALGMQGGVGEKDGLALDIGGGSTEVVRVRGGKILWWRSLPEGVVHLTEAFLAEDPPTVEETEALRERLVSLLSPLPGDAGGELIATAGTPTTLAAMDLSLDEYDPAAVNGHELSVARLRELTALLVSLPARGRLAIPGMEKGREDLIVAGALFLQEVVARWGFPHVTVSDWGLLEGIILDAMARGKGHSLKP